MKNYYITLFIALLISVFNFKANAQFVGEDHKKYTIGEITVFGDTSFSPQTIVTYSGLRKGQEIFVPGEEISNAIKKLWNSGLFNDIDIYATSIVNDTINLKITLADLPEIKKVNISGVKKSKKEEIIKENNLVEGVKVTENLITTTKNYLINKNQEKGYLNTKVKIYPVDAKDSLSKKRVNLMVVIDKGEKVKIRDIDITGNNVLSDRKLRKSMKNTKQKNFFRFYKRSKYIEEKYKEDLGSLIDKYKENGYRDARIISDSLIYHGEKDISLKINLEEGEKYKFGDISFIGNTVYTDKQLASVLQINSGDTYNGVLLEKRIADTSSPDANDITNLYQNNGYLFSTINPVETNAEGNLIDMEIRITEGKPVYFNEVSITGNDVTNDHVIYREIRTRPGELYRKSSVVRTVRELSQLGYFDPEKLTPEFLNPNPLEGTIDMEYKVEETGSSQVQLQGGYGGGGFIGTLGLSFNNFSLRNIFNKEAYQPLPRGDGQKLSLQLQASQYFQTYSFSFSEPWFGGKKPVQFSTSVSHSKQFLYDFTTGRANKSRNFNITGVSVGLAKKLEAPDDYFVLSQAISFQHYSLNNYNTGLFTFGDGYSNNLSFTIGLNRNNTFNDPIYPLGGSNFNVSAKFSLPYSLFNNVDYKALSIEREGLMEELALDSNNTEAFNRVAEIDQQRFSWLEFYKIKFKADWYTRIVDKLVLRPSIEFGYLGAYNQYRGVIPFERFFVGGDGLGNYSLDGREAVQLRGYPNQSIQPIDRNGNPTSDGGSIYNKFSLELRYPITLESSAKIYALTFLEGANAYNTFKDYNPYEIKRSAGLGLRLFMPAFGLLGIDFGYGFDPVPGQTVKNGWETHFIIGQQF